MGKLPLSLNQKIADEVVNLVSQILSSKAKNSNADTAKLEKDIDNLIYKLYNLNADDIKVIER